MSAELHMGTWGSGKTLYVLQNVIIPKLKEKNNRRIVTNIEGLNKVMISALFHIDLIDVESKLKLISMDDIDYVRDIRNWAENNDLIVLDEFQTYFANSEWNKEYTIETVKWINRTRHRGIDFVFISPHPDLCAATLRKAIQATYKHKKSMDIMSVFKNSVSGSSDRVRTAMFEGVELTMNPIRKFTWTHNPKVYQCYQTHVSDEVDEEVKIINIWSDPKLIFFLVGLISLLAFSIYNFNHSDSQIVRSMVKKKRVKKIHKVKNQNITSSFNNSNNSLKYCISKVVLGDSCLYTLIDNSIVKDTLNAYILKDF